jgi:hypothetical protein
LVTNSGPILKLLFYCPLKDDLYKSLIFYSYNIQMDSCRARSTGETTGADVKKKKKVYDRLGEAYEKFKRTHNMNTREVILV